MPKNGKTGGTFSLRQRVLQQKLLENPGQPMNKLMVESGYSKNYADSSDLIRKTKSWQQLTDKILPDKYLLKKNKTLLDAQRVDKYVFPVSMTDEEILSVIKKIRGAKLVRVQRGKTKANAYFTIPNFQVIKDGVELGYRTKGRLAPKEPSAPQYNQFNIENAILERIAGGDSE